MKRIIPFYILKEILPNFFLSLLVLIFILMLAKILELTELVIVQGIKPVTIFRFLLYTLPYFFSLAVPMSTLLAVLLAFLRLSGDNEIVVMKASGVSLLGLLPAVIFFCFLTFLLTSYLGQYLVPPANRAFRNELLNLAKVSADISIKERLFNNEFEDTVIYVEHIDPAEGWMSRIFIKDSREGNLASTIFASRGRITTDKKQRTLVFELFDGVVDGIEETISFDRYDIKLDMESALTGASLRPPDQFEMSSEELRKQIDLFSKDEIRYNVYRLELYKRYSLPFACLLLGLLAVPLGIQGQGHGRNWGISVGLGIFVFYYLIFAAGMSFGQTGAYPPLIGMWMPNIVLLFVTMYLLYITHREIPIFFFSKSANGEESQEDENIDRENVGSANGEAGA